MVKRLRIDDPHPSNLGIVQQFQHKRYGFDCATGPVGDMLLDCVPSSALKGIAHIVPDYHDIAERYSIATLAKYILGTVEERRLARFLLAFGVQVTSTPPAEI